MTNSRKTKRALLSSVTTLLLCFAMLIGSTFAWFTDTATTSVNKIQAGTLDVQLLDAQGSSLEGSTLEFKKADSAPENESVLWEPGCTYNLQPITIKNNGDLALKYKVIITGIQGSAKLNEAIEWTITLNDANNAPYTTALTADHKLAAKASNTLTISGHMKDSAGNEYMGQSIDGIAITVYATQLNAEYDSNGNTYDQNADYLIPWDGTVEQAPAIVNNVVTISSAGQFVGLVNNYNVSYRGTTINLACDIDFGGATIPGFAVGGSGQFDAIFDGQGHTISNFKIESDETYMTGLFGNIGVNHGSTIKNLTVKDAVVSGKTQVGVIAGAINDGAIVENCKVENCTVIGTKKVGAVVGYTLNSTVKNCSATNCTVYCADSDTAESGEIVGFVNTGSTVDNNTATNVTVNRGSAPALVSSKKKLKDALQAGSNIILSADITVDSWTSVQHSSVSTYMPQYTGTVVIDGNGHSISGLTTALLADNYCSDLTVRNLTIKDSTISSGYNGRGALIGYMNGYDVTLENCHLDNVSATATNDNLQYGGFIGLFASGDLSVDGCTAKNCNITADSSAGAFIGLCQTLVGKTQVVKDCIVENCQIKSNDDGGWRIGAIVGTVNGDATLTITSCSESGNTYAMDNSSATNPGHNLYGRIAGTETCTVTVN